jgi:hypothetical protein
MNPEQKQPTQSEQKTNMRQTVLEEMKKFENEFPQKHPHMDLERWRIFFFNNFSLNILGFRKEEWKKTGMLNDSPETRQFFEDIDKTMDELNLNKKELIELWRNCHTKSDYEKFYDTVFNLYIRLREKGYNHYPDLTG